MLLKLIDLIAVDDHAMQCNVKETWYLVLIIKMKTLILKMSIIAQGGLILCKYENAKLQNLQGDH